MRSSARPAALLLVTLLLVTLGASLIAGCGGSARHRTDIRHRLRPRAQVLEVYSSLPLVGPSAAAGRAIQQGIRLAWLQSDRRAGSFLIRYRSLDDARPRHGSWAAVATAANARAVALDPAAMAYIGDFDSSASRVSLPILNYAGIPQISPWSPYMGLTQGFGSDVTAEGDPARYYPTMVRTFLRLAPGDAVQAAALLTAAHAAGCARMAVLRSSGIQDYSAELSGLLGLEHARFGVRIVSAIALPARMTRTLALSPAFVLRRYVNSLRASLAGCVVYVGAPTSAAISAIAAIHAALPRAELLASDRLCQAAFIDSFLRSELVAAGAGLIQCTLPALPPNAAAFSRFLSLWQSQYASRPPPGPWAAYGYEAMRLVLQAISDLGSRGNQRSRVLHALFAQRPRATILGNYAFAADGNSTVRAYGLWQVQAAGPPRLVRVMEPPSS